MRNILVLVAAAMGIMGLSAQQTTMLVHTTDGDIILNDVADVEKITFADAEYNLNADNDRMLEVQ